MSALRRIYTSFVLLFNTVGFGIVFLVMSNSTRVENVVFLANSDVVFMIVLACFGVVANVGLAYVLWRGGHAARRLEVEQQHASQPRITGA